MGSVSNSIVSIDPSVRRAAPRRRFGAIDIAAARRSPPNKFSCATPPHACPENLPTTDRIGMRTDGFPLGFAAGVFALLFVALAWPWLSGAVTIPWDAKSQFQPQLQFLARAIHAGESPFWTPNVFSGSPQIAD